jgi:DBP10CT (NUC160) domain
VRAQVAAARRTVVRDRNDGGTASTSRQAPATADDLVAIRRDQGAAARDHAGPEAASGHFRDEDFFIPTQRGDRHADSGYALDATARNALASAVLDLNAENTDGLANERRRRTVWDDKKKRYVQLQANETMKAGKRVRSNSAKGHAVADEKSGEMYRRWVRQVGGKAGESLGKGVSGGASALGGRCGTCDPRQLCWLADAMSLSAPAQLPGMGRTWGVQCAQHCMLVTTPCRVWLSPRHGCSVSSGSSMAVEGSRILWPSSAATLA